MNFRWTEMQVDSDGQVQRPCEGAEDEQTSAAIKELGTGCFLWLLKQRTG